ncbi:MAG: helix-turn-helix domain-containing protein [Magnetococcales bacterium]|nr:helix-turn-helix domain-containing protein [Magnetococcales bacterium]
MTIQNPVAKTVSLSPVQTIDGAAFLRNDPAAKFMGIGGPTLEKLRCTGEGPRYSKLGKIVVYRISDLLAWAESRKVSSTSEKVGG